MMVVVEAIRMMLTNTFSFLLKFTHSFVDLVYFCEIFFENDVFAALFVACDVISVHKSSQKTHKLLPISRFF